MYYPILRWKAGEKKAVTELYGNSSGKIFPIWWITDATTYMSAYNDLAGIWRGSNIFDLSRVANIDSIRFVSVLNYVHLFSPAQLAIPNVDDFVNTYSNLFGIRVEVSHEAYDIKNHNQIVTELIRNNIPKVNLLVIDLMYVDTSTLNKINIIQQIVNVYINAGFQNIVLASGAFPENISNVVGIEFYPRVDKEIFQIIEAKIPLSINYSDYATINPNWQPIAGSGAPYSNIRYALDKHWLVIRDDARGKESSISIATHLIGTKEYLQYGSQFSWADGRWWDKVHNEGKPGGAREHVAENQNHHISHIAVNE